MNQMKLTSFVLKDAILAKIQRSASFERFVLSVRVNLSFCLRQFLRVNPLGEYFNKLIEMRNKRCM